MIGGVLLIAMAIFGLSWLFGFGKPERLVKFIVWLLFGPILLGIFYSEWSVYYSTLPLFAQIGLVIAVPFVLLLALQILFPNSSLLRGLIDFTWNLLTFIVTFPFRLFWRSGTQITARERNRIRLDRNRQVVGGRPPLRNRAGRDLNDWHN